MVRPTAPKLLVLVAGLLLTTGCASIQPAEIPHHLYLGTYGAAIATEDGGLEDEERLVNEMAEGVGWWTAFRGAEHLIVEAAGRDLRWWERLLVWALPIAINVRRIFDHVGQ